MKNNNIVGNIISDSDIPILFLIFNRPEYTAQVFNVIKKVKPKRLFVAADGPRIGVSDDLLKCTQTRKIVELIDWDCEVKTLFRDENLGCGRGVSGALDWFFLHVEYGIILEDDCVPDASFFRFCGELLELYKDNHSVMMISGTSYLFNKQHSQFDYFFSRFYAIWGWATWRRAWELYDFELKGWSDLKNSGRLSKIFNEKKIIFFWEDYFEKIVNKKINAWGIQWAYACLFNQGLAVTPICNLVSNIGINGTHTTGRRVIFNEMPILGLSQRAIIHPKEISIDYRLEKKIYKNIGVLRRKSLIDKISSVLRFLYKVLHKIKSKIMSNLR